MTIHFILYVQAQPASTAFYPHALAQQPTLSVPGMTEFRLGEQAVLGLMPVAGVRRLLGSAIPDPAVAAGIPRAELYLLTPDPDACHRRALAAGAEELSPMAPRDWGHRAAYSLEIGRASCRERV